jgi:hypothetical protein
MSEGFVTNCLAVHKLGSPHFTISTSNGFLAREVLHKSEKLVESVERLLSLGGK